MKDTRSATWKITFVIFILIAIVAYVYFVAPKFESGISKLRLENQFLQRDIEEIDTMNGDTAKLDAEIAEKQNRLAALREKTTVTPDNMMADLSDHAKAAGVIILETAPSEPIEVGERSEYGVQLFSQNVVLTFSGDYEQGIDFMKRLEESTKGIYRIDGYSYISAEDVPQWMISAVLYYYYE